MALVRANDLVTLCEFVQEATYGTTPARSNGFTGTANQRRFPFVAETMKIEQEVLPLSEEFTPFAGLSGVDLGKRRVRGTVTIEPQYEAQWFWMMFGLAFSYENVVTQRNIMDDTTAITDPADGVNVHIFNHGNILKSLSLYIWKGGPGPADSSHYGDVISGCYITKWTWEQPEGSRAKVTLEFIGKAMATLPLDNAIFGGTAATLVNGPKVNIQHMGTGSNLGALLFGTGAADVTDLNLTGFTINVDRKIDDTSGAFLNEILTANEPGIEGIREVTMSLTTNLETDYGAAGKPWPQFVLGSAGQSAMVIRYDSGVAAATTPASNFGIRFDIPGIVFTDVTQSVSKAGVQQLTATATCPLANITRLGTNFDMFTTAPTDGLVDVRVLTTMRTPAAAPDGLGEFTSDTAVTGLGATP